MKREVVISSYGIVSAIGQDSDSFEENLFAGRSGVRSLRGVTCAEDFPVPYAAYVPRETLGKSVIFNDQQKADVPKSWLMTEQVTAQALSGLDPKTHFDAVVYGTADGVSYEMVESRLKSGVPNNFNYLTYSCESSLEALRDTMAKLGFNRVPDKDLIVLNGACATGNQTIGIAYQGIKSGRWNRVLVGGVDDRCEPSNYLNFNMLGALTTDEVPPEKASRPFAKDRSGFVRGEGAAALVLEAREESEKREAKVLAVVSGYGCTSDAYRLIEGREDAASVVEAIERAMQTAGVKLGDVDYINAHGTSTPLNDRLETTAIKKVFGRRAYEIPVSSLKSQIGHSTIAASSIEAVACVLMLKRQMASPTINYNIPDPDCDLDYVPNQSRAMKMKHILSNSFGFGGQATVIVLSLPDAQ